MVSSKDVNSISLSDFDPWEISKDGLEELIQNQSQAGSGETQNSLDFKINHWQIQVYTLLFLNLKTIVTIHR